MDIETIIRDLAKSKSDTVEAMSDVVLAMIKSAGALSLMPSPAMPLTGVCVHVHPDVYERVQEKTKAVKKETRSEQDFRDAEIDENFYVRFRPIESIGMGLRRWG